MSTHTHVNSLFGRHLTIAPAMQPVTCILMHTNRRMADLGHSCTQPAVALWVRPGKGSIPVCATHAATRTTEPLEAQ